MLKMLGICLTLGCSTLLHGTEIMTVVANKRAPLSETRVPVEVIDREEILSLGAEDLADVLQSIPGIQISPGIRGNTIYLQGLDARYVLILVNGQKVTGRIDGSIDLSRYKAEHIERIEIVRGPSSSLHGSDAIGGVINIITKRQTENQSEVGLRLGTLNQQNLHLGSQIVDKAHSLRIDSGWSQRDAFSVEKDDIEDGPRFAEGYLTLGLESGLSPEWDLIGSFSYQNRLIEKYLKQETGAKFDQTNQIDLYDVLLKPVWTVSSQRSLEFSIHHSRYEDQFRNDQRNSSALDTSSFTQEATTDFAVNWYESLEDHDLAMGLEHSLMKLTTDRIAKDEAHRQRTGLFLQDQWQFHDDWVLVPGLRYDHDSQFDAILSKKLSLRWNFLVDGQMGLSYGEGYRAPDFKELYLVFDNPSVGYRVEGNRSLRPETSKNYGITLNKKLHGFTFFHLNLYQNEIDQLIAVQTKVRGGADQTSVYSYENIAEARLRGIESGIESHWNRFLSSSFSLHYLDAREMEANRQLENRAKLSGKFGLKISVPRIATDLSVNGSYIGARPFYENDKSYSADPYTLMQAHLNHQLSDRWTVYLGGSNLTNEGNRQYLAIEPRMIYSGIRAYF